ncbi:MAG: hypothetical protein AB7F22_16475 [Reyranella sp.]|uniref:hypothetical protein n=1 Tax=Reyranella sp. TaxID=1929291 RepID=UPI003D133CEA
MERTIVATFETRRDAETAVEHLVQEHGVKRTDIFVRAMGNANSAGIRPAGADVESGHPNSDERGQPKLAGPIELSVDCHGDLSATVEAALKEAGGRRLHKA